MAYWQAARSSQDVTWADAGGGDIERDAERRRYSPLPDTPLASGLLRLLEAAADVDGR